MPKRYKKGNKKRKKQKSNYGIFFKREKEINLLLNDFVKRYYSLSYPPLESEYHYMNELRLQIKKLFHLQDENVWKQNQRRKNIYYQQLERFKYYYVAWKYLTFYIYLNLNYGIPIHHCTALSFFRKNQKDFQCIRFQL